MSAMHPDSIAQLDEIMRQSLNALSEEISGSGWNGHREREVVSLFCFGHLVGHCVSGAVLYDPAQISMEVPVPQIRGQTGLTKAATSKDQVCKDIVLWPRPRMVTWDNERKASVSPLSVVEWKHNSGRVSDYDVRWLREFSTQTSDFVGYAVCTNRPARRFALSCTRVTGGQIAERWLHID